MDAWITGGGGAAAAVAATTPTDPETLDDDQLKAFLLARGVKIGTVTNRKSLLSELGRLQYAELAIQCRPDQRQHNPVEQNTKEWFFMRRGVHKMRVGGSEIGVILGLSKFAKPFSLWEKIIKQQTNDWEDDEDGMPEACAHGHTCEDIIAEMFEDNMGLRLLAGGYYRHPDAHLGDAYGASPDRLVLSRGMMEDGVPEGEVFALLEIKGPFYNMYTDVAPQYMAQMQYQMWVSGLPRCYYLAVKLRHDTADEIGTGIGPRKTTPSETRVLLNIVHYSREYAEWMIPRLFYFTKCLVEKREPPHDLYDTAATGSEPPPSPRVDVVPVPNGAWRARPNVRKTKARAASAASASATGE